MINPPSPPHIGVLGSSQMSGVHIHRISRSHSLIDAIIQCCSCLPERDALLVMQSAIRLRRASRGELLTACEKSKFSAPARVFSLLDLGSESVMEVVARHVLIGAGFTVRTQVHIPGAGRMDLWVDERLAVEADGAAFHSGRKEYREDRRRWNAVTRNGIPLLRVTWELVVHESESFVALVRDTLRSIDSGVSAV